MIMEQPRICVYFRIQKSSEEERIFFTNNETDEEIEDFFENICGGVFYWRRA